MNADPSSFDGSFKDVSPAAKEHITSQLRLKIGRVMAIVKRDELAAEKKRSKAQDRPLPPSGTNEGIIAALKHTYEGPGIERPLGYVFLTK